MAHLHEKVCIEKSIIWQWCVKVDKDQNLDTNKQETDNCELSHEAELPWLTGCSLPASQIAISSDGQKSVSSEA